MRGMVRVIVAGLTALALAPVGGMAAAEDAPPPVPVEAEKVRVETVERVVEAIGTLRASESVVLRPEIAGRITEFQFEEGQPVKAGQVLVRLDDEVYRAELAQAEANLRLSRANAARAQQLHREGVGTERALDEANAQLYADEAARRLARAMLDKAIIRAPFDGLVGLRQVSAGAYVTPGQDIARLTALDPMKVDFRVAETMLADIRVDQPLEVQVDAYPEQRFKGSVYAIDPVVDEAGRSVLIRARIGNPDQLLRPGLFARVHLVVERAEQAVTVPEEALMPSGNAVMVFKVVDGKVEPAPVRTGLRQGGRVQIEEGLAPGDMVITAGHLKVRPGAPVTIVNGSGA